MRGRGEVFDWMLFGQGPATYASGSRATTAGQRSRRRRTRGFRSSEGKEAWGVLSVLAAEQPIGLRPRAHTLKDSQGPGHAVNSERTRRIATNAREGEKSIRGDKDEDAAGMWVPRWQQMYHRQTGPTEQWWKGRRGARGWDPTSGTHMEVIDRVEEEVGCVEELAKWAKMKACSPGEFFFFFCFYFLFSPLFHQFKFKS